jgi:glutaredoxin
MKTLIRIFFRTLRLALMPFMLLWARLAMPTGVKRNSEAQQQVDLACSRMALYHFPTCPFCIKVRHEMGRLSLPIELRDAQHDAAHKETLLRGGGKVQTPCLCITDDDGQVQWMYESGDIIRHLQQRFA